MVKSFLKSVIKFTEPVSVSSSKLGFRLFLFLLSIFLWVTSFPIIYKVIWSLSVAVVQGVAAVAIIIVIISFIKLLVYKEGLCFLYMLFLIYYNRRLKFINKGSKIVWWVRDCIFIYWYSLIKSNNFIVKEVYSL